MVRRPARRPREPARSTSTPAASPAPARRAPDAGPASRSTAEQGSRRAPAPAGGATRSAGAARPGTPAPEPVTSPPAGAAAWAGVVAGVQAAVAGLGLVLVPVVLAWLAADGAAATAIGSDAGWWVPARAGGAVWLLAHGAHLRLPDAVVGVAPLGLTLVALLLVVAASRRLAASLRSGRRAPTGRVLATATAGVVAGHLAVALLVLGLSTSPAAVVPVAPAVTGVVAISALGSAPVLLGGRRLLALGAGLVVRAARRARPRPPREGWWARTRTSTDVAALSRVPRATVSALTVLALGGLALVVVAAVRSAPAVVAASEALGAGAAGSVVVVLAQLALLPVAVVWAVALLAGPGFAVGAGTAVSLGGVRLGAVPGLPLLAALPTDDLPRVAWALVAVPVLAGIVAGAVLARVRVVDLDAPRPAAGALARTVATLAPAALVALAVLLVALVLAALSSGGVGPGRMAVVGPQALPVAAALGGEVLAGAALVLGLSRVLRRRS